MGSMAPTCDAGTVPDWSLTDEQPESPTCAGRTDVVYGPYKSSQGEGWSVRIRQSKKGFRCQALADVVLPLTPTQAFDLLTDPEVKQWRQVKECTYRKVWEDDGNRQLVEVEQTTSVFFKTLRTRMNVVQDQQAGTMAFSLGKQGALRLFKGQWTVSAVPGEEALAKLHLEQEMQPAFVPPPPFRRFLRKAMLGKAAQMLSQMREEALRICEEVMMVPGEEAAADAVHAAEAEPQQAGMASPQKLASSKSGTVVELTANALASMQVTPLAAPMSQAQLEESNFQGLHSHNLSFDSSSDC